jgi:PAS domain S-box-containing protein
LTAIGILAAMVSTTPAIARFWDNAHWTISFGTAALVAGLSWRRAEGRDRVPRAWFTFALAAYTIGQIVFEAQIYIGWNPFPGPSDAFFLLLGTLFAVGFISQFRGNLSRGAQWTIALDIAMVAIAALSFTLALYLPLSHSDSAFTTAIMAAYPVLVLLAFGAGAGALVTLRLPPSAGNLLFLGTILLNGLLWMTWNYLTLKDALGNATLLNYTFSFAALAAGFGAASWNANALDDRDWDRACIAIQRVFPLILVLGAALSIAFGRRLSPDTHAITDLSAVSIIALAIIRQSLLLHERDLLLEAERQLFENQTRYRIVADNTYHWEFWLSPERTYLYVSPSCDRISGYPATAFEQNPALLDERIHPEDRATYRDFIETQFRAREAAIHAFRIIRPDGEVRWIEQACQPVYGPADEFLGIRGSNSDISDRRRAEEEQEKLRTQLLHSQKLDAVGQLAGGIAHDFNNMLHVILGFAELAEEQLSAKDPARESVGEMARAAAQAKTLVSHLLAFSRRQIMRPEVIDVNDVISDVTKMMGRVIGEHIKLEFLPAPRLDRTYADRGMLEQVLLNLCVNARDAMGTSGTLCIETGNTTLDSDFCTANPWARPGHYVLVTVSDTGCGMDADTQTHIFEPFFTTKEQGRGTGLGLATVYGIIAQHEGMIRVYSEPGQGSSFSIYLPVTEREAETEIVEDPPLPRGGEETILLAEDDDKVRELVVSTLRKAGYKVIETRNGAEAVETFTRIDTPVDLLIFDVVMPLMSGQEACDAIHAMQPGIPALFSSGYSEGAIHTNFVLTEGTRLIQKPYATRDLLGRVREILDETRHAAT